MYTVRARSLQVDHTDTIARQDTHGRRQPVGRNVWVYKSCELATRKGCRN